MDFRQHTCRQLISSINLGKGLLSVSALPAIPRATNPKVVLENF